MKFLIVLIAAVCVAECGVTRRSPYKWQDNDSLCLQLPTAGSQRDIGGTSYVYWWSFASLNCVTLNYTANRDGTYHSHSSFYYLDDPTFQNEIVFTNEASLENPRHKGQIEEFDFGAYTNPHGSAVVLLVQRGVGFIAGFCPFLEGYPEIIYGVFGFAGYSQELLQMKIDFEASNDIPPLYPVYQYDNCPNHPRQHRNDD
ncbi:hypothetical protein CHUAL_000235 [Chamberlinius hualienensis]